MRTSRAAAWLLISLVVACGAADSDGAQRAAETVPEAERFGGTAVVSYSVDLQTLGVLHTIDAVAMQVQRDLLFMPLVRYDAALEPVPWLAERWDTLRIAPDSLALTFHLRRDVRWHDGTPTTAADVRFTFERVKDPRVASIAARLFSLYNPAVELPDSYTVRFRLRAHADFLEAWYNTPPLPQHLLGDVPPEELATHPFGTGEPLGNGPFRFASRTPGEGWTFEANPDFPAALGGRPYLDRLVFRTTPEATTQATELSTGAVDIAHASPAQATRLAGSRGVRLAEFPSPATTLVFWNTRLPHFADARVRRALTLALDRPALTEVVTHGRGVAGRATVSPFHWAFDPSDAATGLPYDTAGARRLLAEAGWTTGADGVLRDPAGQPFRFTLTLVSANQAHYEAAQIMQAQLRRLGVRMDVRQVEYNTLLQQAQQGGAEARPLEALLMGFLGGIRQDDSFFFHSRHLADAGQVAGYSSPRMDALLDSLAVSLDRQAARRLWTEYQHLFATEAPATVLYYPRGIVAVRSRLRDVEVDGRGLLTGAARWWIAPAER